MLKRLMIAIVALAATAAEAQTLKIATLAPEGTVWMKEMRAAGASIKSRTAGRVEVKFFPGGVMGNDTAVLRKIKLGQLQGGALSGAELSPIYRDASIYSLPFIFNDLAEVDYVRGKIDPLLRAGFEKSGLVAVGLSGGGFAYLMSTKPIANKDDLRATKVWVPQNDRIAQVAFEKAGVNPIALPLGDVNTSLQTGLLETVGITTSGAIAFQWHTKVKHAVDLPLTYVIGVLAIDQKAFNRVTAADQPIVREEFAKAFAELDAAGKRDNESARAALTKQGIVFKVPSADEIGYWHGIGEQTLKQMLANNEISKELLDAILQARAEYRAKTAPAAGAKP
ncbi:MAG: TRAP transporter substrate-binding protein DctP [Xanthomonadales bacterium]|nr:TRAP transporter substrate-binding protein DctP [Xanthomonadales bacterium]